MTLPKFGALLIIALGVFDVVSAWRAEPSKGNWEPALFGSRLSSIARLLKSEAHEDGNLRITSRVRKWIYRNLSSGLRAFLIVFGSVLALNLMARYLGIPVSGELVTAKDRGDFVATLWQIQASVLGITFVVIIFLFQSLSNREEVGESLFRFYVRRSYILPIAFLGLSLILSLGVLDILISRGTLPSEKATALLALNSVLFASSIVLTAFLYWRAFEFLSPRYVDEAIGELIRDSVRANANKVIEEGIGRAAFQRIAEKLGIQPKSTFGVRKRSDIRLVDYPVDQGVLRVADVNLSKFRRLAIRAKDGRDESTSLVFLATDWGSRLTPLNSTIGYLHEDVYSESFSKQLRKCFIVKPEDPETPLDENFGYLKSQALRAIRNGRERTFERLLDKYVEAIRTFSETLRPYKQDYTDLATKHSLFFEWPVLRYLNNDFYALLDEAAKSGDKQLVEVAVGFSREIILLSLEVGDPGIADRIAGFIPTFYRKALDLPSDSETREYLLDHAWKQPNTIGKYYLIPRLTDPHSFEKDVELARQILEICLKTFNKLMKQAISAEDFSSFVDFADALDGMLKRRMQLAEVKDERFHLELEIERAEAEQKEIGEAKTERLSKLRTIEAAYDFLETEKSILWFGIGAWLLRMLRNGEIEEDAFWDFLGRAQSYFNTFEELETVYSRIENDEGWGRILNWDSWNIDPDEWKAGHAISSSWASSDSWLGWFYVVLGLKFCSPTTEPLGPRSSLKSRLGTISGMLDLLEKKEADWIESLRIRDLNEKIVRFRELHQQAVTAQQEMEKAALREKDYSEKKWGEYRDKFLERWENSDLRRLLQAYGMVIDKTEEPAPEGLRSLQINTFYPKEAFIEDSSVHYVEFGESHADAFIRSEREQMIEVIDKSLPSKVATEPEEVAHSLEEAIGGLQEEGYNSLVILTNARIPHRYLRSHDGFVGHGYRKGPEKEIRSFKGYFEEVPLFYMPIEQENVVFYMLDLSDIGSLVQYQIEETSGEVFDFQIEVIDQSKAEDIYKDRLDLRRNESGRFRPKEDVINELREKVILKIRERPHFEVSDPDAGVRIEIRE